LARLGAEPYAKIPLMPIVSVRIPQIGEGLQEARLVAVLKKPGDKVKRDEPIYQMETDKAVMDVESPYEGTLTEWVAQVDSIIPIGEVVAKMDVAEGVEEVAPAHGTAAAAGPTATPQAPSVPASAGRRQDIPPRTRAYAKEKGLADEDLERLPVTGSRLTPEDVDAFLQSRAGGATVSAPETAAFSERPLSQKQRLLSSRLSRGAQLVVPGTISAPCEWGALETVRERYRAAGGDFQPSTFTMFAFAVTAALKEFPMFRSTLVGDDTLRTYEHVHLGIAVALPNDELVIARIDEADTLEWQAFAEACRRQIQIAREGKDQANEAVTISLTNMQSYGIRDAVAVVAPPAVATLFLGEAYSGLDPQATEPVLKRYANLALTFDHRLINGVGAAEFLNAVRDKVANIESLLQDR
jgi:pyruvate dehydrogenase E2 component (dihydrolipoamide acetyltransferase)